MCFGGDECCPGFLLGHIWKEPVHYKVNFQYSKRVWLVWGVLLAGLSLLVKPVNDFILSLAQVIHGDVTFDP